MGDIFLQIPLSVLLAATAITLVAGFVKGVAGFALPMIMISGLGSILPAETALAALILPTFATNLYQSFRQGWRPALSAARRFRLYIAVMLTFLAGSALLVPRAPSSVMFIAIGAPIVLFAMAQLAGLRFALRPETRGRDEALFGAVSGLVGGVSGVWGPPLVAFLVAIGVEKREVVRAMGVIFSIGSVGLLLAHLRSGVLNADTLTLSAAAVAPAFIGLALGTILHDRMPQATFSRVVLVVLAVAGLNLVRRGMAGL